MSQSGQPHTLRCKPHSFVASPSGRGPARVIPGPRRAPAPPPLRPIKENAPSSERSDRLQEGLGGVAEHPTLATLRPREHSEAGSAMSWDSLPSTHITLEDYSSTIPPRTEYGRRQCEALGVGSGRRSSFSSTSSHSSSALQSCCTADHSEDMPGTSRSRERQQSGCTAFSDAAEATARRTSHRSSNKSNYSDKTGPAAGRSGTRRHSIAGEVAAMYSRSSSSLEPELRRAGTWPTLHTRSGAFDELIAEFPDEPEHSQEEDLGKSMPGRRSLYAHQGSAESALQIAPTAGGDSNRAAGTSNRASTRRSVTDGNLDRHFKPKKQESKSEGKESNASGKQPGFSRFFGGRLRRGVSKYSSSTWASNVSITSLFSEIMTALAQLLGYSEHAVDFFATRGEPIRPDQCAYLLLANLMIPSLACASFSDVVGLGPAVFLGLARLEALSAPLFLAALAVLLLCHCTNCYGWDCGSTASKVFSLALFVYLVVGLACLTLTKTFPEVPLIVCCLHFFLVMGLCRAATATTVSSDSFHRAAAAVCVVAALLLAAAWTVTFSRRGPKSFGRGTAELVRSADLLELLREYGIPSDEECRAGLSLSSAKAFAGQGCDKVAFIALLIFIFPLVEAGALFLLGLFLLLRGRSLAREEFKDIVTDTDASADQSVHRFLLLFFGAMCALWIICSAAGSSTGAESSALIFASVTIMLVLAIWVALTVRLADLVTGARRSLLWPVLAPLLFSDWSKALLMCLATVFLLIFLVLEAAVRCCERLLCVPGNHWLTNRALLVWAGLSYWHWASVLEKMFLCATVYLSIWMIFSKGVLLFLSWLSSLIQGLELGVVYVIFFCISFFMFLLPPVPGLIVYMAAGVILVERGRHDGITFGVSVLIAVIMSLFLKLLAVMACQKLIGERLGSDVRVQRLVGVHKVWVRSLELILRRPGLRLDKVLVLCGGPDWLTSVLVGVLHLPVSQMLLCTLPVVVYVVPCVLLGASLLHAKFASVTPMAVTILSVVQSAAFMGALVLTTYEVSHRRELMEMRPEHQVLVDQDRVARRRARRYMKFTQWKYLGWFRRVGLLVSAACGLVCSWVTTFFGSACFRVFSLQHSINESFEEGGLDGDGLNLLLPLGRAMAVVYLVGLLFFLCYVALTFFLFREFLRMMQEHAKRPGLDRQLSKSLSDPSAESGLSDEEEDSMLESEQEAVLSMVRSSRRGSILSYL